MLLQAPTVIALVIDPLVLVTTTEVCRNEVTLIDYVKGVIVRESIEQRINLFEVEFMTPFGQTPDRIQAVEWLTEAEMLNTLAIKPIVVAVSESFRENCV